MSERSKSAKRLVFEVVDGPLDGLTLAEEIVSLTVGRGIGNTIELHADPLTSNEHAVVRYVDQSRSWVVQDQGSTNGTWMDGERLTEARPVQAGMEFLVGSSVIRCSEDGARETFLPDGNQLREESARLMERFDSDVALGYGAAVTLAVRDGSVVLTDRHLVLGLSILNPDLPGIARGKGPLPLRFLTGTIVEDQYWVGDKAWIAEHFLSSGGSASVFFEDELRVTPRLLRCLLVAEARAKDAGRGVMHPLDVLHAVFSDATGRVRQLYDGDGYDIDQLLKTINQGSKSIVVEEESKDAPVSARIVVKSALAAQEVPTIGTVVHDAAREVRGVAALYHLASADERRMALREALTGEVAKLSRDKRLTLLEQLKVFFPFEMGSAPELEEVTRLRRELSILQQKAAEEPEKAAQKGPRLPWPRILRGDGSDIIAGLDATDRPAVILLTEVLAFAMAVERFVVAMVTGMTHGASTSTKMQLPGHRTSIRRAVSQVAGNKALHNVELRNYLLAVETWLVAAVAAYHEGPESWFGEYWGKVSPSRIESRIPKKFGSDARCWARYRELVQTITPDLVSDEMQVLVRKKAQEQFKRLIERRSRR